MALYQEWKTQFEQKSELEQSQYFNFYLQKETEVYKDILVNNKQTISGTVSELAKSFNMTEIETAGFLDGINESLETPLDLENLEPDTFVDMKIDFTKLYLNMLNVPADWLYNLPEWDNIIPQQQRDELKRELNRSKMAISTKVGRNEPCPCGSNKKYKNCCGKE